MAEEEKKAEEESTEEEGGGKKKKLIMIGGGVLLLLLLGGGAFMFMGGSPEKTDETATEAVEGEEGSAEEGEEASEDGEKEKKEKKEEKKEVVEDEDEDEDEDGEISIDFGATHTMKPFHLNLGNPLENRYIQIEVAVEYKGGGNHLKEIEARMPQIRDTVVNVISKKTREFLLGPDGKDQLRLEMLNQINQFMDRKIEAVFITDLLIE